MSFFKKISAALTLAAFGLTALSVEAATITLSPARISVHVGQSFSVAVSVNSPSALIYTVKSVGAFTPSIIHLSTWTYENAWTALRQPGYDAFSNTLGTWIRTAGFADGFTGTQSFAHATFVGEAVGSGTITISSTSLIYNAVNQNVYTGANQVAVTVLPAAVPLPPIVSTPPVVPPPVVVPTAPVTPVVAPALFDVSAGIVPQTSANIPLVILLIFIGGIVCGVLLIVLLEARKRRRSLPLKRKNV